MSIKIEFPACLFNVVTMRISINHVHCFTASEVVAKGGASNAQHIADCVSQWSLDNRVQLNSEKCKELRISFTKKQSEFHPILVNGNQLEVVGSAKLLRVIITNDLSWNEHINETVKKASKHLYFLVQLKRAKLPCRDFVLFYATRIRSILVYAATVFFYALPKYLQCELERVQKRALSIICPSLSYDEALNEAGIPTIISYCEDICDKVFNAALGNKDNKLNKLLTEANKAPYLLRNHRHFATLHFQSGRRTVLRTILFCHRA